MRARRTRYGGRQDVRLPATSDSLVYRRLTPRLRRSEAASECRRLNPDAAECLLNALIHSLREVLPGLLPTPPDLPEAGELSTAERSGVELSAELSAAKLT